VITTLHYFSDPTAQTPLAGLTLGPDGNFYGTTAGDQLGSTYGDPGSTVFKMTGDGVVSTLHTFGGADGMDPVGALTLGPDGNLYGTTQFGGAYNCAGQVRGCGTVFQVTSSGTLTTIYSFSGPDGMNPVNALTLGADGNLYGTTQNGGPHGYGAFFRVNTANSPLSINVNGVVNAATSSGPVSAGSVAAIFGTFLLNDLITYYGFPLPTALHGLSLHLGTTPDAPLFFGSSTQLYAQVPWELAGQTQMTVSVSKGGQTSGTRTVALAMYAPGLFAVESPKGQGAILDAKYNLVSPGNPATAGASVHIYCTGLGPVTSQPATGSPALASPLSWTTITPTATIGGAQATVLFSGLVPNAVGLYEVEAQVPMASTTGPAVPVTISVGGAYSNTVYMAVR
jgi:uncharacterized protein (TIGR03437 family)